MAISVDKVVLLSNRISLLPDIRKFDSLGEREADRIAYGIADVSESAAKLEEIVERLLQLESCDEVMLGIVDLFEELNHILYHIKDMKSFEDFDRQSKA